MSLLIDNNLIVSIHYKLSDQDGKVIDDSAGEEPLKFLHGAGNIIPGLENALVGKAAGDSLQVTIEPADGYGEFLPELIQTASKTAFEGVENLEVGMSFQGQGTDGTVQNIIIKKIDGNEITIDANHPLAGVELNFDVEVTGVRAPTEEELAHGHPH